MVEATNDARAIEAFLSQLLGFCAIRSNSAGLETLRGLREAFEVLPDDAKAAGLLRVAKRRLLASNTLRATEGNGSVLARAGWDTANTNLASVVLAHVAPAGVWTLASQLNADLRGFESTPESPVGARAPFRTAALHSANETYVAPSRLTSWLAAFETKFAETPLLEASHDPENQRKVSLTQAFVAYAGVVTLHPFDDANGRTARLLADVFLLRAGWLPLCFLSPVESHVASTVGGRHRHVDAAFETFLRGVKNAYEIALKPHDAPGGFKIL